MKPELNSLAAVREELASVYRCAKVGTMLLPQAKDLAGILKTLASIIRDEREMDVEEQLNEIRAQINTLKGEQNNASLVT